jgi:redox-sensitive bicupin YhaK (pirin superfamily)
MIDLVIPARRKDLGGFEVGRVLPYVQRRMVGPFIFLDHMGPVRWERGFAKSVDVRPHPHIGLATVTYLFEGEITHRDSLGVEQNITPGAVNWMTAGRGISHSERFERLRTEGGTAHGLQAWVALPEEHEEDAPAFEHQSAEEAPAWSARGVRGRLVAGSAFGVTAPVKTHSPLFYLHLDMEAGAVAALPADHAERAIYVVSGAVEAGGRRIQATEMAVFGSQANGTVTALEPSVVVAVGGEPVGPRHIWWNFVSSRKERIEQAKADWAAGRFTLPNHDNSEWIPLPDDLPPKPEPNPMS